MSNCIRILAMHLNADAFEVTPVQITSDVSDEEMIESSIKQGERFDISKVQEQVIHIIPESVITNQNHEQKQQKLDKRRYDEKEKK